MARVSLRLAAALLVVLVAVYVGFPLYWKLSATIQEIREKRHTVREGSQRPSLPPSLFFRRRAPVLTPRSLSLSGGPRRNLAARPRGPAVGRVVLRRVRLRRRRRRPRPRRRDDPLPPPADRRRLRRRRPCPHDPVDKTLPFRDRLQKFPPPLWNAAETSSLCVYPLRRCISGRPSVRLPRRLRSGFRSPTWGLGLTPPPLEPPCDAAKGQAPRKKFRKTPRGAALFPNMCI